MTINHTIFIILGLVANMFKRSLKVKIYTLLFAKDYERDKIADTLLSQVDTSPKVLGPEDNNS